MVTHYFAVCSHMHKMACHLSAKHTYRRKELTFRTRSLKLCQRATISSVAIMSPACADIIRIQNTYRKYSF